jgi:hypothetical protein
MLRLRESFSRIAPPDLGKVLTFFSSEALYVYISLKLACESAWSVQLQFSWRSSVGRAADL